VSNNGSFDFFMYMVVSLRNIKGTLKILYHGQLEKKIKRDVYNAVLAARILGKMRNLKSESINELE
jgi:hypothetical protein